MYVPAAMVWQLQALPALIMELPSVQRVTLGSIFTDSRVSRIYVPATMALLLQPWPAQQMKPRYVQAAKLATISWDQPASLTSAPARVAQLQLVRSALIQAPKCPHRSVHPVRLASILMATRAPRTHAHAAMDHQLQGPPAVLKDHHHVQAVMRGTICWDLTAYPTSAHATMAMLPLVLAVLTQAQLLPHRSVQCVWMAST